jgi:FemAB-related protein (PEP-CTERM system-associated)
MRVEVLRRDTREWTSYVDGHPRGNVYHLPVWRAVAERAYGLRAPHLLVRDEPGAIRGVLPLFMVPGLAGGYVTNGLFGSYGRILCDGEEAGQALLDEARRITRASGARYLMLKALDDEPLARGFVWRDRCVIARLPLDPDPDEVWRRLRSEVRRCVRKAQRGGLELRVGPENLRAFYDVLAENMHRKGTPIYGFPVLRELCAALGDRAEVVVAFAGGEALAGAVAVYHRGVAYTPFASSRERALPLSPNNLVNWEVIRRACMRGMAVMDFGRSPRDSGGLAYKLGWGAEVTPQPFLVEAVRGVAPALDVEAPWVRRLTGIWRGLPRFAADALGPRIYRRFLA